MVLKIWKQVNFNFCIVSDGVTTLKGRANTTRSALSTLPPLPTATAAAAATLQPICQCRPEEFPCSSSSTASTASPGASGGRRKGQLPFTIKVMIAIL